LLDTPAVGTDGSGCSWYVDHPADCGKNDDDDFIASQMCCGCVTTSGDTYQIVQSGTCASAGGESLSSGLDDCNAAAAGLSIAWTDNMEYDSLFVPPGCIVTDDNEALYFNPQIQ